MASHVIEFTVLGQPSDAARAMGAGGFIYTEAMLTPRIIEALNKFWLEHSSEYGHGDSFSIDVGCDA